MNLLFATIFILFISIQSVAQTYVDYLKEGDNYFEKFDNLDALKYYQKAYLLAPEKYEALLKLTRANNDLGEEYYLQHDRTDAKKYISQGVEKAILLQQNFPDSASSYATLALCYGNMAMFEGGKGKVKLAEKVEVNAKKAIKMNPDDFLPYIIMGIYYREAAKLNWFEKLFANTFFGSVPEGTFEQSLEMLNKALKLEPKAIVITYELAKTYRAMGNKSEEIKLLRKINELPLLNFRDKYIINKSRKILRAAVN